MSSVSILRLAGKVHMKMNKYSVFIKKKSTIFTYKCNIFGEFNKQLTKVANDHIYKYSIKLAIFLGY